MPELTAALKVASEALVALESEDAALQACIAEALALSSEASGDLNAAETFCIATIPRGRPMQVKRLVEILARVRYTRGSKDFAPPVDAKAGGRPNALFTVCALCVAIVRSSEKGEASMSEHAQLLDQAIKELTPFKDAGMEETPDDTTREDDEERMEFESELWVRIANESLSQGLLRQAQRCCGFAVRQLPAQPELRKRIPVNVWRWFSVAECVWGRAIAGMVNDEGQDRTSPSALGGPSVVSSDLPPLDGSFVETTDRRKEQYTEDQVLEVPTTSPWESSATRRKSMLSGTMRPTGRASAQPTRTTTSSKGDALPREALMTGIRVVFMAFPSFALFAFATAQASS